METQRLLTTTRSVRKSLDLDAPVDRDDIRECLRTAVQAANGTNQQTWRWLAIFDLELRQEIAALYRDAYLHRVGGQLVAGFMPAGTAEARLMSSTEWLVEHMAQVPLLVIPCYSPICRASKVTNPSSLQRHTARYSRRFGTYSSHCTPAATGHV